MEIDKSKMSSNKEDENVETKHEDITNGKKTLGGIKTMPFILGIFFYPLISYIACI